MAETSVISGGTLGVYGSLLEGKQKSDVLNFQANIQNRNAAEAVAAAKFNANKQNMMATKLLGSEAAGYGASGVTADSGSVLDVIGASAANAEMDHQNILHGGEIRAVNYENQASLDSLGAKNALTASYFNAISSITGSSYKLASMNPGSPGGDDEGSMEDSSAEGMANNTGGMAAMP